MTLRRIERTPLDPDEFEWVTRWINGLCVTGRPNGYEAILRLRKRPWGFGGWEYRVHTPTEQRGLIDTLRAGKIRLIGLAYSYQCCPVNGALSRFDREEAASTLLSPDPPRESIRAFIKGQQDFPVYEELATLLY